MLTGTDDANLFYMNSISDKTSAVDDPLVCVRDLHFTRGSKAIFRGLDFDVPRGKVTTILGPSGTGKTTLLKMIGGQLKPLKGSVSVDGKDVARLGRRDLYALRKRMGMLFQSGALLTDLTVFENVAFPLREHTSLPESLISHMVLMRLHAVGLRGARDLHPARSCAAASLRGLSSFSTVARMGRCLFSSQHPIMLKSCYPEADADGCYCAFWPCLAQHARAPRAGTPVSVVCW